MNGYYVALVNQLGAIEKQHGHLWPKQMSLTCAAAFAAGFNHKMAGAFPVAVVVEHGTRPSGASLLAMLQPKAN